MGRQVACVVASAKEERREAIMGGVHGERKLARGLAELVAISLQCIFVPHLPMYSEQIFVYNGLLVCF